MPQKRHLCRIVWVAPKAKNKLVKRFWYPINFGEESYYTSKAMKRVGNLWDKVISVENLMLADTKARMGKTQTYGVKTHDKKRKANILSLHESLKSQTFKTSEYEIFTIREPKEREIYRLPYYPDRITHHAIMNVLEPIWVSIFNENTYACIKKKGIHAVAKRLKYALKNDKSNTKYCLKLDVKKFYPSIDHDILKKIIRRRIKDKKLLWLLDEIIDSVPDEKGVPIGNYLSQYFANLYLAYFDHWLKEEKQVKYYWRYADDIVILAPNKQMLHDLLHEIRAYLDKNLNLKVKPNYQIFPVDARGIDFVGYVFFHTHTLLRKTIKQNLFRKVSRLNKLKYTPTKKQYKQKICAWWGWCKYCNSINLMTKIKKSIPYEIRFTRA